MSNVVFVILLIGALAGAEAVYHLARFLGERKGEELKRRLRAVGETTGGGDLKILRQRRMASSQWLSDALGGFDALTRLEKLLEQTDLDISVAQMLTYSGIMLLIGAGVGIILRAPALAVLLALVFACVPLVLVLNSRAKRSKRLSEQLPDALDMMARAIQAGHALPSSFKLVAQECPMPVAIEFAKAYEQQNLGIPFETAVFNMTERVPTNTDLKLFAVSVSVQKETGGNLVEVLDNIAHTMRERFKFFSKLRALTAEGRISGVILGSLPFVVALLIALTNPTYLGELTQGIGRIILVIAIVMWSLGVLWIRVLLEVDY